MASKALAPPMTVLERDAQYAQAGHQFLEDSATPQALRELASDPRVTVRRAGLPDPEGKCVVYWMQRAQRGHDNHALNKAVDIANALGLPVVAYFAGISNFIHANLRHYTFLNQGLPDVEEDCTARNVGFVMRRAGPEGTQTAMESGKPGREDHLRFFADVNAAIVIGDENPMRAPEGWRVRIAEALTIPYWTVDADVIVPSKLLLKAQFSAGVARPRLYRALAEFLKPYDNPVARHAWRQPRSLVRDDVRADITRGWKDFDRSVLPVDSWRGGHQTAVKRLEHFCKNLLPTYDHDRNHPEMDGSSKLSPYLHYGHISPLTIALAVDDACKGKPKLTHTRDSFFNELIAWRELSVNFVRYNPNYDNTACADNWAQTTIAEHDKDQREKLYPLTTLERGETGDELWNAGQLQMVRHGWMHNYMRMYWIKKIVEWTPNAATAMKHAIYLNDRYEIDGRDPGGYTGIAWGVLGKFDRAWGSRPVFGKRRFMSGERTAKKFDSRKYVEQINELNTPSAREISSP